MVAMGRAAGSGSATTTKRVVIAPRDVVPSEFVHPLLPVPKMQSSPEALTENTGPKVSR